MFNAAFDTDLPDDLRSPDQPSAWTRAREDYQAGESASTVCERYRITRSTFFARAKAEGWRRSDAAPTGGPDPYVAEMEAAIVCELMAREATPAYALARRAWAMAEVALLNRRRVEAQAWVRLARDLRKLAMEEAGAITWRRTAQLGEAASAANSARAAEERSAFEEPLLEGSLSPRGDGGTTTEPESVGASSSSELPRAGGDPDLLGFRSPDSPASEEVRKAAQSLDPRMRGETRDGGDGSETEGSPGGDAMAPDYGLLPLSILSSPARLTAFLESEFGPADSPDQSERTLDSPSSISPAQARAQVEARSG